MTVTASQTEAGHGGGDGAAADAGLRTNEHHSNDLPNVHGPALCLGARACIGAFLHPHLIVSLLTFLVMLAHSSTSVPSSEKLEQLLRRSSRSSRGEGETFEQLHQSRPSGEVSAGCCTVLLSRRIPALWSARGELERTQDPAHVRRQFFARFCDTGTTLPFRNWLCGQTGTQESPRLASRGVPTSCDELSSPDPAASVSEHGRAEQPRAGHPRRDHGSPGRWRVRASSGPRHTEVQGRRNGSPRRRLDSSHPSGASSGSEAGAQGRDEAQALSRRRGRHEEQGQEHAGRQREGRGQGPGEGEGRQEERRLRLPDHAARREGPRQEGDGEGERERKGGRHKAAVDGTGSEVVDCELAGGLDALMLDAFGASVLGDAARLEKGMLLDDGQVDAIDSEFLEKLTFGFHACSRSHPWAAGEVERPSLKLLEALHVGLNVPSSLLHVLEALHVGLTRDTPTTWCVTCFLFPALRWKPTCYERCSLRLEAAYARRKSGR